MCKSKILILYQKLTQSEKCRCAFCLSLIHESSDSQFVFTKLGGLLALNAAKNLLL